ncbi:MAG TPA: hypothetical protein VF450_25170, partial [Noviherbaspirillum sp.]
RVGRPRSRIRHKRSRTRLQTEGLQPKLMDSRRTQRSSLFLPSTPTQSGKAAFSLKNLLVFQKEYSDAGIVAGVFFGCGRREAH